MVWAASAFPPDQFVAISGHIFCLEVAVIGGMQFFCQGWNLSEIVVVRGFAAFAIGAESARSVFEHRLPDVIITFFAFPPDKGSWRQFSGVDTLVLTFTETFQCVGKFSEINEIFRLRRVTARAAGAELGAIGNGCLPVVATTAAMPPDTAA